MHLTRLHLHRGQLHLHHQQNSVQLLCNSGHARPYSRHSVLCTPSFAISVKVADGTPEGLVCTFPHLGSGLLFARSTGLKIWPGARVISQLLLTQSSSLTAHHPHLEGLQGEWNLCGKVCVELGAGLGLVSLVAAAAGAQVICTDGDPDLVRLLDKNLKHNWTAGKHAQLAQALLPWGDKPALEALDLPSTPDVLLLADLIYGSNPGVWDRLVSTLTSLSGQHTLIIQAESRRIEGQLFSLYWEALKNAGFVVYELDLPSVLEKERAGGEGEGKLFLQELEVPVRCWMMHRRGNS